MEPRVLKSKIDPSVNFVWDIDEKQAIEARYVRRHDDYVACYLSTQTGCAQACRMCHLTFTGQNDPRDVTLQELIVQVKTVMDYVPDTKAKTVHYNFMARGEPLSSQVLLGWSEQIFLKLGHIARKKGLLPRILISTIMPEDLPDSLVKLFPTIHPEIYYSLYSMSPDFRRRWMPKAMDPDQALDMLTEWQRHTKKIVRIHHALIRGENDSWTEICSDTREIAHAVRKRGLRADFTLVRYNPPSERHGSEPDEGTYWAYAASLQAELPMSRIKIIDRVGFDVAASCGMFVS